MEFLSFSSPIGNIIASADKNGITSLKFIDGLHFDTKNIHLRELKIELEAYFKKELKEFKTKVSLNGTNFELSVWNLLKNIAFGEVVCYLDIAKMLKINSPKAVAKAISKNPVLILIPCHRVILKSGKIGGYSGGVEKKRFLLELERS